jgi:ATP-dependent Clp protease ATP-binding subunit ClpA
MITSSSGIGVDCQGVVLIMTTNLDAESSSKNRIGFGESSKAVQSDVEFNKFFSPEFRNRLDAIITFSQLSKQAIHDITVKFLDELSDKVEKLGSEFYYDDNVVEVLMSLGYDEKMGARPMKRVIEQQLKLPISIILSDKEDQTSIIVAKVVHGEIVAS